LAFYFACDIFISEYQQMKIRQNWRLDIVSHHNLRFLPTEDRGDCCEDAKNIDPALILSDSGISSPESKQDFRRNQRA
jgi:hypothetical protein